MSMDKTFDAAAAEARIAAEWDRTNAFAAGAVNRDSPSCTSAACSSTGASFSAASSTSGATCWRIAVSATSNCSASRTSRPACLR